MATVAQSRFALLQVEDDDGEVDNSHSNNKNDGQKSSNKKKNKKKKKVEQLKENDELKSLAFAKGGPHRHRTQSGGTDKPKSKQNGHSEASESQWNDWIKADQNYTDESYEKDLEQALLMSKMEYEEKKEVTKAFKDAGINIEEKTKEKKKKKKDKPQTMSLEEFNAGKTTHNDEIDLVATHSLSSIKSDTPNADTDPQFFSHVEDDVEKILRKEKMQEEYQRQYAAERVMTSKHESEIAKKDKEIQFLKATVKKLEEEYKQVKKRNKQLCVILAQGEMKEKAEVLVQVQQLSEVKDELTQQVQELTAELEKERSKVHSLKSELDKAKGHGTKHSGK